MNLYLISQSINNGYETFDSAVVAARGEAEARLIHPDGYSWDSGVLETHDWVLPGDVTVRLIGEATNDIDKPKVICSSFNAG